MGRRWGMGLAAVEGDGALDVEQAAEDGDDDGSPDAEVAELGGVMFEVVGLSSQGR